MAFSMCTRAVAYAAVFSVCTTALQNVATVQHQQQDQRVPPAAGTLQTYAKRQDDLLAAAVDRQMRDHVTFHDNGPPLHGGLSEGALKNQFKRYTGTTVFIFGAYHKTGCELAVNLMANLRQDYNSGYTSLHSSDDINLVGDALDQQRDDVFLPGKWDNFYYEPRFGIVDLLPDFRMVHMIRDPVNIIVSAYRFHTQCPPGEPWLLEPMSTLYDVEHLKMKLGKWNPHLLHKVKRAIKQNVSICKFYQQKDLSEQEGVVVEAYRSQRELELMARNYAKTATDMRVLQVPMESILANFYGTMECIFTFLGQSRKVGKWDAMDMIKELDVSKAEIDPVHVTHGKFDNAEIEEIVRKMPHVIAAKESIQYHENDAKRCGKF